jgi:kynureninase
MTSSSKEIALKLDQQDSLNYLREEFIFPKTDSGKDFLYFAGNSLGLQPKQARKYLDQVFSKWASHAVEGHFFGEDPWITYNESVIPGICHLVGAQAHEVVAMNTLTINLHSMLISFFRPNGKRTKIVMESSAFPSDIYAVKSQLQFHNLDPRENIIELLPRQGESLLRDEDILKTIDQNKDSIALVLIGNVNYLTGQCYDMTQITQAAHKAGALVGFDLAHGVGNLNLSLHNIGCDFAIWCHYKYVNGGPGTIAGAFIHERHAQNKNIHRLAGWWGQNKQSRFQMGPDFDPIPSASGWQSSNPPVFQLAVLRSSLEIFQKTSMEKLKSKADQLTQYFEQLVDTSRVVEIITPRNPDKRGTQLSLRIPINGRGVLNSLKELGAICDFREPNVIRLAPAPLYTKFMDLYEFHEMLKKALKSP